MIDWGQHGVCLICHRERPLTELQHINADPAASLICATDVIGCHMVLYAEHGAWEDPPDYQHPDEEAWAWQ